MTRESGFLKSTNPSIRQIMDSTVGGALAIAFLVALTTGAQAQNPAPNYGTTRASKAMSEADIRAYKEARSVCDRQSGTKQDQCRTQLASKWGNVDPKCEKLSGSSLDACLRGADHGQ